MATPKAKQTATEAPEVAKEEKAQQGEGKLVSVVLVRGYSYRQPSTGIVLSKSKPKAEMKDDSWLQLQIKAGLIRKA